MANGGETVGDDWPAHVRVAVIGTGFGGLGAGVRLIESGVSDFVILERAAAVGGTWRDNTYPGCACDVPSHLYSFSFAPNPDWSHSFSRQPQIRDYLESIADRYRLRPHIRFRAEVHEARWDDDATCWRLLTERGPLRADVVIAAAGPLADPVLPDGPGLRQFPGAVFHSARWGHSSSLAGKRVAVIGTGASAIQIVPELQRQAARLVVFQRTPAWVLPRRDRAFTRAERCLYRHLPTSQRLARGAIYAARECSVPAFTTYPKLLKAAQRIALRHLTRAVADPDLRAKLTPHYVMGCKRILLSNDYYPALAQPNVDVVASGPARVDGNTVIAQDGTAHEVDAIVLATGFHTVDMPIAAHPRPAGHHRAGRPSPGPGALVRRHRAADGRHRLGDRGLPELVPQRGRPQPHALARHTFGFRRRTRRVDIGEYDGIETAKTGKGGAPPDYRPARPHSELQVRSTGGVALHTEIHGRLDAPTVVLVHGWTNSTRVWAPVIRALGDEVRIVAYDQRGHGASGIPGGDASSTEAYRSDAYSTDALVDDLAAVLEATVPSGHKAVLVGHSMGAMAIMAAGGRAAVLAGTAGALLASTGCRGLVAAARIVPLRPRRLGAALQRAILRSSAPMGPASRLSRAALRYATLGPGASPELVAANAELVHACGRRPRGAWGRVLDGLDVGDALAGLDVPVHVLVGTADRLTPTTHGPLLAQHLLRCVGVSELPEVGHMTPLEAPQAMADLILKLVAESREWA